MNILDKNIAEIRPYAKNAKEHTKKQIQQVANSIKRFGFVQPIVIDKNNEIVIGHCRYEASKLLDLKEVPCLKVENLSDKEISALRLADNKLNESSWDMNLVIDDLKGLDLDLLDLTGFDKDLLIEPDEKDDIVPENVPSRSKLGDLYELGQHRVLCGDSTQPDAVLRLMDGKKADMVFTDPPYNVNYSGRGKNTSNKIENDNMSEDDFHKFLFEAFTRMNESSKAGSVAYVWHGDSKSGVRSTFEQEFRNAGWHLSSTIIWSKKQASMGWQDYRSQHEPCLYGFKDDSKHTYYGNRSETTIWNEGRDTEYKHPTQKPTALGMRALKNSSKGDDICLDSFLGSGSTLIASEKTGRICYGMELDPKYVDVIVQRYVDYTGIEEVKLNGEVIQWKKTTKQQ